MRPLRIIENIFYVRMKWLGIDMLVLCPESPQTRLALKIFNIVGVGADP